MIPIGIATGHIKQPKDLEPLMRLDSTILKSPTFGSYTLLKRDGNTEGRNYAPPLNALGLPNLGIDAACEYLPDMCDSARSKGFDPRISVAGFTPLEFITLLKKVRKVEKKAPVELNWGCPNVRVEGKQKPIIAFDEEFVRELLTMLRNVAFEIGVVDVKLSPDSDPTRFFRVVNLIGYHDDVIRNAVCCNTFPDAYGFDDDGNPLLEVNDGYGGLSGDALHQIALGRVRQARAILPDTMGVIGVGGVKNGRTLRNMESVGASEAHVGLAYFDTEDPGVIQQMVAERALLD